MKKLLICVLSCVVLITTPAKAETVLYCQSELATGFIRDNGAWKTGKFAQKRWTIKFNDNYSIAEGLTTFSMECVVPYPSAAELIFCVHKRGSHETFLYNLNKNRFTFSSVKDFGYVDDPTGEASTDVLYAGSCTSF
jgi:hypothetical protein